MKPVVENNPGRRAVRIPNLRTLVTLSDWLISACDLLAPYNLLQIYIYIYIFPIALFSRSPQNPPWFLLSIGIFQCDSKRNLEMSGELSGHKPLIFTKISVFLDMLETCSTIFAEFWGKAALQLPWSVPPFDPWHYLEPQLLCIWLLALPVVNPQHLPGS